MAGSTFTHRSIFAGLLAALFLASSAYASAGADLITFAPDEGGFSVLLPSQPQAERQNDGQADMHMWKLTGSPFGFVMAVGDYAAHLQADPALDYYMDNFIKGAGGTMQSQRKMSFAEAPDGPLQAVDFVFTLPQVRGESIVVVSGDRTYQIAVMYPKDYDGKEYAERILSSFKITAPAKYWKGN